MFTKMPTVSIIIPVYKQIVFLPETLDSVCAQMYSDWECIIVNDGSPEDVESMIKYYLDNDARFKYIVQHNQGPSVARNNGVKVSSGRYILPLDSDDTISEQYIYEAVSWLDSHPDYSLVYCRADMFDKLSGQWNLPEYSYDNILWSNSIFCSAIIRRDRFDKTVGYNPNMVLGWEDWDFWLSYLTPEDKVKRLDGTYFHYRIKEKDSRSDIVNSRCKEMYRQLYNNHKSIYEQYCPDIIDIMQRLRIAENELAHIKSSKLFLLSSKLSKLLSILKKACR